MGIVFNYTTAVFVRHISPIVETEETTDREDNYMEGPEDARSPLGFYGWT